jgi:two-component system response regulator YesN
MLKLMIVDDELLMRIGIRSMIDWEAHGFQIAAESANGKEALEIAHQVKPDLIITDIKMPIMDGLELIREASNVLTNCKYVIVSNFDEFGYVKEALRLGAIDYLIKSEITPEVLIELLAKIKNKSELKDDPYYVSMLKSNMTQSLGHLKESFFKDLISGLMEESEATVRMKQLQIAVQLKNVVVIKLRIDQFAAIRQKYVEQDERLLRFSIVNIVEEVISRKWHKEVIVESSSEYLLITNSLSEDWATNRSEIGRLCGSIQKTMKDFMNLSISIGVSSLAQNARSMRTAYQEADRALHYRFFVGSGCILFEEELRNHINALPHVDNITIANDAHEIDMSHALDSRQAEKLNQFFDKFREVLIVKHASERIIREAYIRLTENISAYLIARHKLQAKLPYEALFSADTWDHVHQIVLDYAKLGLNVEHKSSEQSSYTDLAVDMINRYYAESISLQSVANQINVNPSYLSRLFKQEKGENFISYLTQVRIERAKSFLESGQYKVYEVADKVGYHNYTYFSKIFKKVVGVSPEEYRG